MILRTRFVQMRYTELRGTFDRELQQAVPKEYLAARAANQRGNYYGGSLFVGHVTTEQGDVVAPASSLRTGTEVEVTLTPDGMLLDGSVGHALVVTKAVTGSGFAIRNIPVGQYRLTAKGADGTPLLMRLTKPKGVRFGIALEETTEAVLSLPPGGAKAGLVAPGRGSWQAVEVQIEWPKRK